MKKVIFFFVWAICAISPISVDAKMNKDRSVLAHATSYAQVKFQAGESRKITLIYQNIGTETWVNDKKQISVILVGASSHMYHPTWIAKDISGFLNEGRILPGAKASATFYIHAPEKPGVYTEKFVLSNRKNLYIKGSASFVRFVVTDARGIDRHQPLVTSIKPDIKTGIQILSVETSKTPVLDSSSVAVSISTKLKFNENDWKAEIISRGGSEFQIEAGMVGSAIIQYKNTGTAIWTKTGLSKVELQTDGGDEDQFQDASWPSVHVVATLKEEKVLPNQIGTFTVNLRAPEIPGMYNEDFILMAASGTKITGSEIGWKVRVPMTVSMMMKGVPDGAYGDGLTPQAQTYKAILLVQNTKALTLLGNGRQAVTFGFKNEGTAIWNNLSARLISVSPLLQGRQGWVRDESWLNSFEPQQSISRIAPGEIGYLGFTVKAPAKKGNYTAKFVLRADGQNIENGMIEIPITVTADGWIGPGDTKPTPSANPSGNSTVSNSNSAGYAAPALNPAPLNGDISSLPEEPLIRVGLFKTLDNTMVIRGVNMGFTMSESGNKICDFSAGESVTVVYDRGARVMRANGPRCSAQTTGIYVAEGVEKWSPLEITDFSHPVGWLPGANDNTFRGKLELRYTPATDAVWVINELPIELYLKGLAETSDVSPMEFQRALLTAARTYALYHVYRGTKHADESYTVDATYDQVYRGYGAEARSPSIVAGIESTRGQIVTYGGSVAITPYFSRSDGRTRSWGEVWYGGSKYPWLIGVAVPEDAGKILWGHGVGMSATGALIMAAREGKTYDAILKYFYTGIELRRAYK